MSTTLTRTPAFPSTATTDPCAAPVSATPALHTQPLQDTGLLPSPQSDQPDHLATATAQKSRCEGFDYGGGLQQRCDGGAFHQVHFKDGSTKRFCFGHIDSYANSSEAVRVERWKPAPAAPVKPVEEKRLTLSEYIRLHNATATVEEFAAAVQALTTCASVRIHAAQSAAAGTAPLTSGNRFRALLSVEFWSNVAFALDMLHRAFIEELERRDEAARARAQAERQAVLR